MNWRKILRVGLLLLSVVMYMAGIHDSLSAHLTMVAPGAVVYVERDPYNEFLTHNYVVHYAFSTAQHGTAYGTYLLENALTIGDVPRRLSDVQISYSAYDPSINRPSDGNDIEYVQVFQALLLFTLGSVMLLGGLLLR